MLGSSEGDCMRCRHVFFKTKAEAEMFIKLHGYGTLLAGKHKKSETLEVFEREKALAISEGMNVADDEKFCVAWAECGYDTGGV